MTSQGRSKAAEPLAFAPGSVLDDYDVLFDYVLGEGLSGGVVLGVRRDTGEQVAVKLLPFSPAAVAEATLHARCAGHPNVVALHGVYRETLRLPYRNTTSEYVVLVMEKVAGGELFGRLADGPLSETQACTIVRQLASVLSHMHSLNIMHSG